MNEPLYIAVDLGAGSGRVFLAGFMPGEFLLEEVRRFHYPPDKSDGHLRWNALRIFDEIKAGMREAGERARKLGRAICSIGVDSWAVDYGLLDGEGELVEQPVCYRDGRTESAMEEVFARVPREDVFARTGIQFQVFNTLFQLYAHAQSGIPETAARMLLIPDLINFFLTGKAVTEYTNATTTQMVKAASGDWDLDLIERLALPSRLLAEIVPAGTNLGPIKPALARDLRLEGASVIATATHDTASAVAGAPLKDGWAFISSGTWSLVGVERYSTMINAEAARLNFTNEGGAFGTTRFLKNVMGLWILESCRGEWKERGFDLGHANLNDEVEAIEDCRGLIFPDDRRFFNPPSMPEAITEQLVETGQRVPADPPAMARVILDSLAFRYASVLRAIESLTNRKIEGAHIVGGGSRNDYLNQATANVTGLPVMAGPAEATATGNALVQAIAHGRFRSLADARLHAASNMRLKKFAPRPSPALQEAARRYAEIEARYLKQ
ncbi:MAG TPA: rhamnulokinase family protein [Blastocatellia bacterium]|nr:rhamnulokinase family protein [Blastocatellia bacterium]